MSAQHIFRVQRNKDFVTINKTCLEDKRLSLKAKGLHCLMLAQKDDWIFYMHDICDRSSDGIKATRNALNELQEFGYANRYPEYENGKIVRWVTDVYEYPQPTLCKPCGQRALSTLPFCTSRKRISRKRHTNKNNSNNNNNFNKNNIVIEPPEIVDKLQDIQEDVVLNNVMNVDEQTRVQIHKRLRKMASNGIITHAECPVLQEEVEWHITHKPDHMSAIHALNAALAMIKKGVWSTPKKMRRKEAEEWETKYEHEKLKERQECVESELGKMLRNMIGKKYE